MKLVRCGCGRGPVRMEQMLGEIMEKGKNKIDSSALFF